MHTEPDSDPRKIHEARFRLLGSAAGGSRRSIVLGRAVLERPAGGRSPWTLAVRSDAAFEPTVAFRPARPSRAEVGRGMHRRPVLAIAVPGDFQRHRIPMAGRLLKAGPSKRGGQFPATALRTIYGWSLAYRFPDSTGPALVDPHEDLADLPAFYESPAELVDRILHLESRGIETRPIALLVSRRDFVRDARGAEVNRFFPVSLRSGG